jgi:two-component system response regulator HydG
MQNGLFASNNLYVGTNPAFQKALQQVNLVSQTNYSVIIYGESGTGKEMIAKLIHEQSERRDKPFVAIDCGALTEELANSELFGHEKGAFTGALQFKRGCLEEAHGGTVFLDEIANLSYSIQVALLRVLQERKIKRIGSSTDTPIDVRIIVASNEQLTDKIQSGLFREDLYYRLNEFYIELPALRDRKEDIPNMVTHFINESNKELGKSLTGCSTGVLNILLNYDFPGNLRELKNIIRRSCLVARETITVADLPSNLLNASNYVPQKPDVVRSVVEEEEYPEAAKLLTDTKSPNALKDILQLREFELILKTLKEHKYNKSKVARLLKIDRKTLYNKLASFKSKNFNLC